MRLDPSSGRPFESTATCLHFRGGVLAQLDELAAIYLPNANSYRGGPCGAPLRRSLGRVEAKPGPNSASVGGDVNLYAVLAALLAADADGIRNRIDLDAPDFVASVPRR